MDENRTNIIDGRYRVFEQVDQVGNEVIFRALDTKTNAQVTLVRLDDETARDYNETKKFIHDATVAQQVSHPNLVRVITSGDTTDDVYRIEEHLPGWQRLDVVLDDYVNDARKIQSVAVGVLQGLAAAHDAGVLHGAVTAENVYVNQDTNQVKLGNIGAPDSIYGHPTPASYLAPELLQGMPYTESSDIYSAGTLLYLLLTGNLPFIANSREELWQKVQHETPAPPVFLSEDIPLTWQKAILQALQKDPMQRPTDADSFAAVFGNGQIMQMTAAQAPPRFDEAIVMREDVIRMNEPPVDYLGEEPSSGRNVRTSLILLALLILFGVVGWWMYDRSIHTEAPNVVGQTQSAATKRIESADLRVGDIEREWDQADKGTVINQSPDSSTKVKKDSDVNVTVSDGPSSTIPDLSEKTQAEAEAEIQSAGLELSEDIKREYNADVPDGQIISQQPEAGEQVARGETIAIILSQGPQPVPVPDVAKKPLAEATTELEALGFKVVSKLSFNATVVKGSVISQAPVAATELAPGQNVTVVVSRGPQLVVVPKVTDLTLAKARQAITKAKLKVGKTTQAFNPKPAGTVLTQSIGANTKTPIQSTVNLTVSQGPRTVVVPNLVGQTEQSARAKLTALGFTQIIPQAFLYNLPSLGASKVCTQDPDANTSAAKSAPVVLGVYRHDPTKPAPPAGWRCQDVAS